MDALRWASADGTEGTEDAGPARYERSSNSRMPRQLGTMEGGRNRV